MSTAFYVAQGISVLTALTAMVMMQFRSMKKILAGQIVANLLTASTYFLLGGFSGAGICFVAIVQSVVMFLYDRKGKKPPLWVLGIFIALYLTCSAMYFSSFMDIVSALAAVCFAVSIAQQKASASRAWYVMNPLLWMIYDLYTRAYANFLMHLVIFISTVTAMIRLDLRKKTDHESKNA
jgi:hypothetical protein